MANPKILCPAFLRRQPNLRPHASPNNQRRTILKALLIIIYYTKKTLSKLLLFLTRNNLFTLPGSVKHEIIYATEQI